MGNVGSNPTGPHVAKTYDGDKPPKSSTKIPDKSSATRAERIIAIHNRLNENHKILRSIHEGRREWRDRSE